MKHVTILLAALVLVLGIHSLGRADAPAGVTKWEYQSGRSVDMNKLGMDGWELVMRDVDGIFYFKRPLGVSNGTSLTTTALRQTALSQMRSMGGAIDLYYLENRSLPKSLDDLTRPSGKSNEPYMKSIPMDPWKEAYEYKIVNAKTREVQITSAGEDKQMGTDDDIVFPDKDDSK